MPVFAVLAAAANVGGRKDAAHLHPDEAAGDEAGRERDVEAAVAVEQGRIVSVELGALFVGEEHGDPRAVLALVEDMLGFVVVGIEAAESVARDRPWQRSRGMS